MGTSHVLTILTVTKIPWKKKPWFLSKDGHPGSPVFRPVPSEVGDFFGSLNIVHIP